MQSIASEDAFLGSGRWRKTVALMLSLVSLLLAACGSSGSTASSSGAKSTFVIDFANASEDGAVYQGMEQTLKSALAGTAGTLHVYNNNSTATTIFQNLSTMIAEKPDVIIEVNPLADASQRISEQLQRSGIPCIAPNVPIPGCAFFNEDVAPLGKALGDEIATMMAARGWTGADTEVIPVEIASYGSLNDALWQWVAELSNKVPGMTPIAASSITTSSTTIGSNVLQINPDYSLDSAFKSFATVLQGIPAGKHMVVDCLGDDTCLGVYRALNNAGRLGDAMLMGWGTSPQGINFMRSGSTWVAESANYFSYWGEFLAPMALAVAKGVKTPPQTFPPQTIVTKANVDQYFNSDGSLKEFPPLPAASQYLVDQGVLQRLHNVQGVS